MKDAFGRKINYMRISVTDRCNLRCRYCMPEGIKNLAQGDILRYEEILRICRCAGELGIIHFKITGGEPLVRRGIPEFMEELKRQTNAQTVTLTTNGVLLGEYLDRLAAAGLDGINISLDTLNRDSYRQLTGADEFPKVWENLMKAMEGGIPLKINCIPIPGFNEEETGEFLKLAARHRVDVRFIEMMPLGMGAKYRPVASDVILRRLQGQEPGLVRDWSRHGNGPAVYYKSPEMKGSIGFIGSVHHRFCRDCNRIRLSSAGAVKSCLCYEGGADLRRALREGASDGQLIGLLEEAVRRKPAAHDFYHPEEITERNPMSQIGG